MINVYLYGSEADGEPSYVKPFSDGNKALKFALLVTLGSNIGVRVVVDGSSIPAYEN